MTQQQPAGQQGQQPHPPAGQQGQQQAPAAQQGQQKPPPPMPQPVQQPQMPKPQPAPGFKCLILSSMCARSSSRRSRSHGRCRRNGST